MANGHLLVPIKVEALVVDDLVIERRGALVKDEKRYVANSGRWTPVAQDYRSLTAMLASPAPKPFFGADRKYDGKTADQLIAPKSAWPDDQHRGVYLHWVLPSGLRHAHKIGTLDFPALPDQWLIVRFCRRNGEPQKTRAWFVDGSLAGNAADGPTNLLFNKSGKREALKVGKVVPLEEYTAAKFEGEHTTINAAGNTQTGSPTFTASIAENRNILSWHDTLNDLREPPDTGAVATGITLSYLLVGWYRNEQNEPLTAIRSQLSNSQATAADVLKALGWTTGSEPPADILQRRSLFHGIVSHLNYWTTQYKGNMLGYPGAPPVEDVLSNPPLSFRVGVGNNAEDALVSLVSSGFSGFKDKPNLWKALEAVVYRKPESLVGSWNTAPRDHAVHQHWFATTEAGTVWSIVARAENDGAFPSNPAAAAKETKVKPTRDNLQQLAKLNKLQSEADEFKRELTALQQDLYARWWKLAALSLDQEATLDAEADACRALVSRVAGLRKKRSDSVADLTPEVERLKAKLVKELELRSDAAPRFWTPADPVIVVENAGVMTKHRFPNPLPCRLPDQVVTKAEVVVEKTSKPINSSTGVQEIQAALSNFVTRAEILRELVGEASLVEQAIEDLAQRTSKQFNTANDWELWLARLKQDVEWDGKSTAVPRDELHFYSSNGSEIRPAQLLDLWERQPWSPLFLDWQITWVPTSPQLTPRNGKDGKDFGPTWPLDDVDYGPLDRKSLEPFINGAGVTVRGRSLLSPIDQQLLDEPIKTLRSLLKSDAPNPIFPAEVVKILEGYDTIWDKTLKDLGQAGLMGQALSGFHQALLARDLTAPRVMPDAANPWIDEASLKSLESEVRAQLDDATMGNERLLPPADAALRPPRFSTLRTGAFKIDELWLVDDFGQWADLLGGTPAGNTSSGQVFHPRVRWHDDQEFVAMPPRVIQPVRLNFRFTASDETHSALSSICGWVFYNPLDRTLVLCERDGRLAGELVITGERSGWRVRWRSATGAKLADVSNKSLRLFAEALVHESPTQTPRLLDLLSLVDNSLQRIRPAAARRETVLFGRPLALVNATLGLELFGKAWSDPSKSPAANRPVNTGDELLDELMVQVNLGCSHNTEDGLVGYFANNKYDRLIATHLPKKLDDLPSGYVAQEKTDRVAAGFRAPVQLTLLTDPWGSVQAACGLVPAKEITLAQAELDQLVTQLETSYRVGPVLLQPGKIALPAPAGDKGHWSLVAPITNDTPAPLAPFETTYFGEQPVVATEGRLVLLTPKE